MAEVRQKRHTYQHPHKQLHKCSKDGAESIRLHRTILEMIALRNRPFTIVKGCVEYINHSYTVRHKLETIQEEQGQCKYKPMHFNEAFVGVVSRP